MAVPAFVLRLRACAAWLTLLFSGQLHHKLRIFVLRPVLGLYRILGVLGIHKVLLLVIR